MAVYDIRSETQSFTRGIRERVRVTAALVRMEIRRQGGDSRLGYLWELIFPALGFGIMLYVFSYVLHRRVPLGTNTALFLITAIIPYYLYMKVCTYTSGTIGSSRSLLTLPPVKLQDVVAACVILEGTTFLLVGVAVLAVLYAVLGVSDALPYEPLFAWEGGAMAILLGLGLGLINAVIVSVFHGWMLFFSALTFPMWLMSGVWFLPEQVPEGIRTIMLYNPLMHIVMLFRLGFYREYQAPFLDVEYALGVIIALLAIGLALLNFSLRRVLSGS